jgi:ATP/ADP translocase
MHEVFQVLRRASNFAVSRPSREVLFTVLRREDKYEAKSFIDTFVYRVGDQVIVYNSSTGSPLRIIPSASTAP